MGISFCRNGTLAAAQSTMLSPERPKSAAVAWPGSSVRSTGTPIAPTTCVATVGMRDPVRKRCCIHEETDREVQCVRLQPFDPRFGAGNARLHGQARALQHVQSVASGEKGPEMKVFGYVHHARFQFAEWAIVCDKTYMKNLFTALINALVAALILCASAWVAPAANARQTSATPAAACRRLPLRALPLRPRQNRKQHLRRRALRHLQPRRARDRPLNRKARQLLRAVR